MAWTPPSDPIIPLHGLDEGLSFSGFFVYTPDEFEPLVTHYTAEWLGRVPEHAVLSASTSSVQLVASDLLGIAPIEVHYQRNRIPGVTTYWDELPADAEEIILYVAPGEPSATTTFAAHAWNNDTLISTETYTILVTLTYNTGRDRLIAEVNARS